MNYQKAFSRYLKNLKDSGLDIARFVFDHINAGTDVQTLKSFLARLAMKMGYGDGTEDPSTEDFLFYASVADEDELNIILDYIAQSDKTSLKDKEDAIKTLAVLRKINDSLGRTDDDQTPSLAQGIVNLAQKYDATGAEQKTLIEINQNALVINYSEFMARKMFGRQRRPSQEWFVSQKFSKLDRKELVEYFEPNRFYQLSKGEICELLQAVTNEYCEENFAESCRIEFGELKTTQNSIVMGEYSPADSKIVINRRFLDGLEKFKEDGNEFMPYQILNTIIHEAQHHIQSQTLDRDSWELTDKELLVKKALLDPQPSSYQKYLASYEELDARDAALKYMATCARNAEPDQEERLKGIYSLFKSREDQTQKQNIPEQYKINFSEIYGKNPFEKGSRSNVLYNHQRSAMMQILRQGMAFEIDGSTLSHNR